MANRVRLVTRKEKATRKRVAKNIRRYAQYWPYSLRGLAQEAQISTSQLFNILGETSAPTTDLLTRLAAALNVEVGDFFVDPSKD